MWPRPTSDHVERQQRMAKFSEQMQAISTATRSTSIPILCAR
jgi:hypothetical protein